MKRGTPVVDLRSSDRSVDGTIDLSSSPSDRFSLTDESGDDHEIQTKRAKLKPVARKTFVSAIQNDSGLQAADDKNGIKENGGNIAVGNRVSAFRSDQSESANHVAHSNDLSLPSTSTSAIIGSSSTAFLPPPPLQKAPNIGVDTSSSRSSNNPSDASVNGVTSAVLNSPLTNGWRQHSSTSTSSMRNNDDCDLQITEAPSRQTTNVKEEGEEELEFPIPLCRCTLPTELRNEEDPPAICQAVSTVDGLNRGCSNSVGGSRCSSAGVPLFRAHVRCPFQALCVAHSRLLRLHHCCPTCGVFCLRGDFNKCSGGHPDHWFHRGCEGVSGACPHCLFPSFAVDRADVYHATRDDHLRPLQQKAHVESASTSSAADPGVLEKSLTISARRLTVEDRELLGSIFSRIEEGTLASKHASLEQAIQADDVESVCCLISANCDVNANINGDSLLHLAVERNALLIVYLLIDAGANPNTLNTCHFTPLMLAAEKGFDGIANALLLLGANPNCSVAYKDTTGCTALHIAASLQVPEVVWALIKFPRTNINAQTVDGEWTPLIYAVENERPKNVQLLLDRGAKPLLPDLEGNVALHWAAFSGCVDVAECLLAAMGDRDLDTVNLHRDTPLHVACRQGKWNMAGLLLERGADGQLENGADPPETAESLAVALRAPKHILDKLSWSKKRVNNRVNWLNAKLADDISRGHERIPVRVINEVDKEWSPPDDFNYVSNIYESGESSHNIERRLDLMNACSCVDQCSTNCLCCETEYRGSAYQKNGRLADDVEWGSACEVIVECSPACKCDASCQNRVVQKGMQVRVELFKTVNRGWAVRCQQRIPKGTYICEYAGEILTSEVADARDDDTYLFEIESGGHNHCIDAGKFGNISRFINHHCDPNLTPVKVLWDHPDRRYPHICFFAKRDVPEGEELTFDYGDKFWEIKGRLFTCKCLASNCRYNEERIEEFLESRERLEQELSSGEVSE